MTVPPQQILEEAVHLPLVEQILSSFDLPAHDKIDALWAQEAEDRIDAFDRGELTAISASQVFERIDRQKS